MDFNAGSSVGRRWAELLAASGQLHGRHWAGSHGRRQTSADERFVEIVNVAGGVWFALSVLCIVWYLCYLAWESLRAYQWCRTDRPTLKPWRGATTACQVRGTILRRGPLFRTEDWKRYWSLVRGT